MTIGVAQVIGMKPTLRSFFSGGPPAASVTDLIGKNCDSGRQRRGGTDRFQESAARHVMREHRTDDG